MQYLKKLWRIPDLLAKFPSPDISPLDLGNGIPLGGHQHRSQGRLQGEFLPDKLGCVRLGPEQL